MNTVLEVREVSAGYGSLQILHGVSLEVPQSQITCIIGPNGAGKSTLLKTIFGFVRPTSGHILFHGKEITGLSPSSLLQRGLAYVPQGRSIFPAMSVDENLLMGLHLRAEGAKAMRQRVDNIYENYPILARHRRDAAGSLSGGEQRILEFGRTLLLEPQLVMLDEPSIGLSPKLTNEVYEQVVQLNVNGVTVLIVEQNVSKALEVSHYGYVLDLGQNRFHGKSEELMATPELVRLYLGAGFES